jgi:hypothetical protein
MGLIEKCSEHRLALYSLLFSQELYDVCTKVLISECRHYLHGYCIKSWLDCIAAYEILLVIEY